MQGLTTEEADYLARCREPNEDDAESVRYRSSSEQDRDVLIFCRLRERGLVVSREVRDSEGRVHSFAMYTSLGRLAFDVWLATQTRKIL